MSDIASHPAHAAARAARSDAMITMGDIKRFTKRYTGTIAVSIFLGLAAAAAYAWLSTPLYTARAQLIIDPTLPQLLAEKTAEAASIDNAQIESQLEVLRSEKISLAVIDQLKLTDASEFQPRASWMHPLDPGATIDADLAERVALSRYQQHLDVRRIGVSYAIEILYSAEDPELAARIANATAEAYIQEQFAARADAAQRGNAWLEQRIEKLRSEMNQAALEAQQFRARRDYRLGSRSEPAQTTRLRSSDDAAPAKQADAPEGDAPRLNTIEELDSTAQTYRRIYESYLRSYTESVQKQSYPLTNARVITDASPIIGKSHPRSKLILALGGFVGCFFGFAIAFFRHSIDRSVTNARQVRDGIGVECLASVPRLGRPERHLSLYRRLRRSRAAATVSSALDASPGTLTGLARIVSTFNARAGLRLQGRLARLARQNSGAEHSARTAWPDGLNAAVAMPFSGFSRGVKALKTAIALASRTHNIRTIAVTSALPNEGKSTLTANLAALYAANGVRVLLIDGDLHTGRLSQHLAGEPGTGIVDALEDPARLDDCIVRLDDSGVDLLPATNGSGARCDDLLASPAAGELMAVLQKTYELVIVELPPLVASADSLAVSAIVDGTIVVAEWGKTPMPVLGEAVHLLRNAQARILGVALNKVDTSAVSYGEVSYGNLAYWSPPGTKRRA